MQLHHSGNSLKWDFYTIEGEITTSVFAVLTLGIGQYYNYYNAPNSMYIQGQNLN